MPLVYKAMHRLCMGLSPRPSLFNKATSNDYLHNTEFLLQKQIFA